MAGIDKQDFEQIFSTWYEPIRNFLYFRTGDIQVAEDLTQDTFLKIWEKRNEVRQASIKPFLYTLANNLFLNRRDHLKVHFKFVTDYQYSIEYKDSGYDLEMKEFDKKLQEAINKLDDKKRTVFLMNKIEKLTYKQIAESLGITPKAVEKRMGKALAYLKMQIEMNI
jgi:RNA polymerase sigma-70 factor (family 1)